MRPNTVKKELKMNIEQVWTALMGNYERRK